MSMTKIQKELLGALIGLARSVDGRGEAAKGESQEFSSGDSNGHRPDKATHEILLGGICAANPERVEGRRGEILDCTRGGRKEPSESGLRSVQGKMRQNR